VKVVVDTNVLFSFFKSGSATRDLILNCPFGLVSPKFALVELKKYSGLIMKKAKISEEKFKLLLKELKGVVEFVDSSIYVNCVRDVKDVCPDEKDVDFLALAFFWQSFLWSNDAVLKRQDKVKIYSTREVVDMFFN
jgi:predicted nucleic acid-binding protein